MTKGFYSSTYHQHLQFGYGPEFETARSPTFFNLKVGKAKPPMSFKDECLRAAKLIAEMAQNKRILVAISGGLDSEVVARSFFEAKISFEAAILRYTPDLNEHDIKSAKEFCNEFGIKINYLDVDIFSYYKSKEHESVSSDYFCNSPMFSVHLELCRHFKNDLLIFAGVAPTIKITPEVNENFVRYSRFSAIQEVFNQFQLTEFPEENQFCFEHFFRLHGTQGVPNFFLYTSELILSSLAAGDVLLQYQEIQFLGQKHPATDYDSNFYLQSLKMRNAMKHRFYKRVGFDVAERENKYTGFENIHLLFNDNQQRSKYQSLLHGMTFFNKLFREPMEQKLPKLKLAQFQIDQENKAWLQDYALKNWISPNISII